MSTRTHLIIYKETFKKREASLVCLVRNKLIELLLPENIEEVRENAQKHIKSGGVSFKHFKTARFLELNTTEAIYVK